MKRAPTTAYTVLALAVLGAAGFGFYRYFGSRAPAPPVHVAPPPQTATPAPAPTPRAPLIRHPIPPVPAPAAEGPAAGAKTPAPAQPLPPLDRSDPVVLRALEALAGHERLARWLNAKGIVRRIVVTVDNVPRRQIPPRYLPLRPVPGSLVTRRVGPPTSDRYVLGAANYARYTPYVDLLTAIDPKRAAAVYIRFYPLFQQAYRSLGYPYGYFNDRLVEAIDSLLRAPQPSGPVRLRRPSVYYKFADPRLEALPAGQKVLIRMGPANARRVKAWLRAFRAAIERR